MSNGTQSADVHVFASFKRLFHFRYVAILLAAGLGTLATVSAALLDLSWEYRVAEINFYNKARVFLDVINTNLADANTLLYTVGAYVDSSEHPVSRSEFERFSSVFRNRIVGLRDVGWAPRVSFGERSKFEQRARAAGFTGYRLTQNGPRHSLIRAGNRPEYYPLLFTEAGGFKLHVLGFDLLSDPVRAAAVARALRTGQPAATPPTSVTTIKRRSGGTLGYMAVGRFREPNGRWAARGIVLGVFDLEPLVDNIINAKSHSTDLDLYMVNPRSSAENRLIYWRPSLGTSRMKPSEASLRRAKHYVGVLRMLDQRWDAIVTPAEPLDFFRWSWQAVTVLAVGLTMTSMIVAYLIISLQRTRRLEALTASLRESAEIVNRNAEQIAFMARHDALTGLPNRLLFQERMDQATKSFRDDAPFAVLCLDLDHFKAVNDTLGHGVGDRLLCAVAQRLPTCLRQGDTVARLGGDEFAIILGETETTASIATIAQRITERIATAYTIDGHTVTVGVSIGIALATNAATTETLLKEADLALYEAKGAGRGQFRIFEPRLQTRSEANHRLERELRLALERDEFEVHYQPIVRLADNRVTGFEALVRWNNGEHGLLPPEHFIALAEERGLIAPLGTWVLRTACEHAAGWPIPIMVAVNISPVQFQSEDLLPCILAALSNSGLAPDRLEIEITEAAVLQESETTLRVLNELRAFGVRVAFDDFGTGFSSLSSVLRFPFDKIKIDRSFVTNIETSSSAAAIVRAICGLGSSLGLATTGEGVETLEQMARLRKLGCTEAQGYLFSPARTNAEIPTLLRSLSGGTAAVADSGAER